MPTNLKSRSFLDQEKIKQSSKIMALGMSMDIIKKLLLNIGVSSYYNSTDFLLKDFNTNP